MDKLPEMLRRYLADEPYRRLPDDDLWSRFRDHRDEAAFRVLLERVGGRVHARCRAILGDESLADEAFQEAFVALIRHREKLPGYGPAVAWLYQTATNTARAHRRWWRRAWRRDRVKGTQTPEATAHAAEGPATELEERARIAAALADLPERERRAIELVYLEGMTHDEAAAALGWGRGTVGTYVARGLKRLRDRLGPMGLAALVAPVPAVVPDQLLASGEAIWAMATAVGEPVGSWPVLRPKTLAAGLVVCLGITGGVAWWPRTDPSPKPPAITPPPAVVESVPDRNRRVYLDEVLPKQLRALRGTVLGDGEVEFEGVETYDTRVVSRFSLKHRVERAAGWVSRIELVHNAAIRATGVYLDIWGDGRLKDIDPAKPIILWRNPLTGSEITLQVKPLSQAVEAFVSLPQDERAAAERAAYFARYRSAVSLYLGEWYRRGDPAARCSAEWKSPDNLTFHDPDGQSWQRIADDVRIDRSGRVFGIEACGSRVELTPDGRRLNFLDTGDWWTREPLPKP